MPDEVFIFMLNQKAVTAYLKSKQLLGFGFVLQIYTHSHEHHPEWGAGLFQARVSSHHLLCLSQPTHEMFGNHIHCYQNIQAAGMVGMEQAHLGLHSVLHSSFHQADFWASIVMS